MQDQFNRLRQHLPLGTLDAMVNSLPSNVTLFSACSGSGSFELAARAAVDAIAGWGSREMEVFWLQNDLEAVPCSPSRVGVVIGLRANSKMKLES